MLGETVGADQLEGDTMFTDEQIQTWIDHALSLEHAALRGWRAKLARYSDLVNVTDGAASRSFSDLSNNARYMVDLYSDLVRGATFGRTRIGKIVRSE